MKDAVKEIVKRYNYWADQLESLELDEGTPVAQRIKDRNDYTTRMGELEDLLLTLGYEIWVTRNPLGFREYVAEPVEETKEV